MLLSLITRVSSHKTSPNLFRCVFDVTVQTQLLHFHGHIDFHQDLKKKKYEVGVLISNNLTFFLCIPKYKLEQGFLCSTNRRDCNNMDMRAVNSCHVYAKKSM